jgi:hypothetical protein
VLSGPRQRIKRCRTPNVNRGFLRLNLKCDRALEINRKPRSLLAQEKYDDHRFCELASQALELDAALLRHLSHCDCRRDSWLGQLVGMDCHRAVGRLTR